MAHARSSEIEVGHPQPTLAEPADPVLRRIGLWLRDARTRRGLDLHDVADELRIKPAYLRALEDGDLAALPGRSYALGFLRSYGFFLDLDGDELVRRVKAEERGEAEPRELSVPTPMAESRLPKLRLLVASLFLVGGAYGGWHYVNDELRPPDEMVAAVPAALREAPLRRLPPPVPAAPGDPARAFAGEGPAVPSAAEVGAAEPPPAAALNPERPQPVEAPPAAADDSERAATMVLTADLALPGEAPAAEPRDRAGAESGPSANELLARLGAEAADRAEEGRVYGRTSGEARVRLEALDTSWIQVRSSDNTFTYTRTLQPGDVYLVPNRTDLALWTGNAGALRVVVDGRSLPSLGRLHEVKRDLPLDPARLLAGVAGVPGMAADRRR